MMLRMRGLMAEEGLPYGERKKTYNSRLAQELAKWAETQPGGEKIHDALFRAYFVDGLNLAQGDVLLDVAKAVGLDGEEAARALDERPYRSAVDADWQRSRQLGVTGVPTFVAGGLAVGRSTALRRARRDGRQGRRKTPTPGGHTHDQPDLARLDDAPRTPTPTKACCAARSCPRLPP